MNLIIQAARLADEAHRGVPRKWSGRPYIEHCGRVANRVMLSEFVNDELVAAAWLHDVVEDRGADKGLTNHERYYGNQMWLRSNGMPRGVIIRVVNLTNESMLHPELNRTARKFMDIGAICGASLECRFVKILDRIDNLGEMSETNKDAGFVRLYHRESLDLYHGLRSCPDSDRLRQYLDELRAMIKVDA